MNTKLILLTGVMVFSFGVASEARADSCRDGGLYCGDDCAAEGSSCHWEIDSSGKLSITGSGAMKNNSYISYTENNVPDNRLTTASYAQHWDKITSIDVGAGITTTGTNAFQGLSRVTTATISKDVENLPNFAFDRMPSLQNVIFENSSNLTNIGTATFQYASSLESIDIPKGVMSLGQNAFYYATSLGSVTFAKDSELKSIGQAAFYGNQLTSVDIPEDVTSIGKSAFYGNQLISVDIPDGVTDIGAYAFSHNSLASVDIPESVTDMGNYAFGNNQLTEVTIPSGLTSLSDGVFYKNQLSQVILPEGLISIGYGAFAGQGYKDENGNFVSTLTSIEFPNTLEDIGSKAFFGAAFTTLDIPDSLKNIGHGAFYGSILEKLILPDTVDFGGTTAFNLADENAIVLCRGNFEDCRDKLEQKNLISQFLDLYYTEDGGLQVELSDVGEFNFSNYGVAKDADCNTANYYYDGSRCVYEPDPDSRTCDYELTGYIKVGNYCASPAVTYAKKRYTPAEAAQWLRDDDTNVVTLTFKK